MTGNKLLNNNGEEDDDGIRCIYFLQSPRGLVPSAE